MNKGALFVGILMLGMIGLILKLGAGASISYLRLAGAYSDAARSALRTEGFYTIDAPGLRFGFGALRDKCALWVAPSEADGDNDALFSRDFGADADVVFIYDRKEYGSRPDFNFFKDKIAAKAFRVIGRDVKVAPVFAVSLKRDCLAEERAIIFRVLSDVKIAEKQ